MVSSSNIPSNPTPILMLAGFYVTALYHPGDVGWNDQGYETFILRVAGAVSVGWSLAAYHLPKLYAFLASLIAFCVLTARVMKFEMVAFAALMFVTSLLFWSRKVQTTQQQKSKAVTILNGLVGCCGLVFIFLPNLTKLAFNLVIYFDPYHTIDNRQAHVDNNMILGAVMVAWAICLAALETTSGGLQASQRSIITWFVVDTTMSALCRVPGNVLLNLVFFIPYAVVFYTLRKSHSSIQNPKRPKEN